MSLPARLMCRADYEGLIRGIVGWFERRIKVQDLAVALTWGLASLFLYVLGFVVADHAIDGGLTHIVRLMVVCCVGASAAIGVLRFAVWPLLRRINSLYVARLVECRYPELGNTLVTTFELSRESGVEPGVAAGLIDRAAHELTRRDLSVCIPTRNLARASLGAAGAAALLLAYAALAPKAVWPSLLRAFGAAVAAPTRTHIEWLAPEADSSFVRGTALAFEARLSGRLPREGYVEVSTDAGRTWDVGRRLTLAPVENTDRAADSPWRATLPPQDAQTTLLCRITAGDAVTPPRRFIARSPPAIERIEVTYHYPAYCRLPDATRDGGDIDAVVGTRVELAVRGSVPLAAGAVRFADDGGAATRTMEPDARDGRRLTASWTVTEDAEYRVSIHDADGAANLRPVNYRQRARADQPPRVELSAPPAALTLDPDGSFELRGVARDDYGLHGLSLVYRNGVVGGRLPLPALPPSMPREATIAARAAVAALKAQPGDVIEWHIEACDNRCDLQGQPAYQCAAGTSRTLNIGGSRSASSREGGGAGGRAAIEPLDSGTERSESASSAPGDGGAHSAHGAASRPSDAKSGEAAASHPTEEKQTAGGNAANSNGANEQAASRPSDRGDNSAREGEQNSSGDKSQSGEGEGDKKPGDAGQDANDGGRGTQAPGSKGKPSDSGDDAQPGSEGKGKSHGDSKDKGTSESGQQGDKQGKGDKPGSAEGSQPGDSEKKGTDPTGPPGDKQGPGGGSGKAGGAKPGDAAASRPTDGPAKPQPESKDAKNNGRFAGEGQGRDAPADGGRADRAVDELERRLRDGKLDDKQLAELGWTRAQAEAFVRDYRRRAEAARERSRSGEGSAGGSRGVQQRAGARGGDDALRLGGRTGAGVGGGVGPGEAGAKGAPELRDAPREEVPADYRDLLEAYYRDMARSDAPQPK